MEFEDEIFDSDKADELIKDMIWSVVLMLIWAVVTVLHAISLKKSPTVESLDIANIVLSSLLVGIHLNNSISTLFKMLKIMRTNKKC